MRIGLDAHMLGQKETGNETYVAGLLAGFAQIGVGLDAYVLDSDHSLAPIHRRHRVWPARSLVRVPVTMPALAMRDRLDLFHATYVLPPVLPCPGVVTVHDITFALHPEWFEPSVRRMLSTLVPRSIRNASAIITISEHTKSDIVQQYGIAPERITVTYLAPRPAFLSRPLVKAPKDPFFLYVGNLQPRKNVELLIWAQGILHRRGVEIPLRIVGAPGGSREDLERLAVAEQVLHLVQFLGYQADEEVRRLYATCTALLHPALYEGFGLTVLEAMTQGAPVVASNTSSIPEVAGQAALLLDPDHPEQWADAMEQISNDADLRACMSQSGCEQAATFSWERCARQTLDVYRSVAPINRSL